MTIRADYTIEAHPDSTVQEDLKVENRDDGVWVRQGDDALLLEHEDTIQELIRALQLPVEA